MGHEIERREALKCMAWAGTGALYALSGGIARSTILDGAVANTQTACMQHSQLHEDATVYGQVRDLIYQPAGAAIVALR